MKIKQFMSLTVQKTTLFFVSVVVFLVPAVLRPQSQNLPLEHWAYSFLDRLQTRGLYISEDFDTRPYSREAVAEIISQIDKRAKADPTLLSKVEWGLFEQLKGEFHEELENTSQSIVIRKKEYEPHLFSYRNEDIVVHWDGLLSHQNKIESKKVVDRSLPSALSFVGLNLRANIKKSLAIFAQGGTFFLSDADSLTADSFNPSLGLPVTKNALVDVTVTDQTIAYLVFRLPWLDVEAGRDMIEWGPGFRGNLALSRNSNVYDMFKFDFRYKRFKFESFHAFLNAEDAKYLAGHRLEIRPSSNVQFALSETVVYGNRSVEFL
ncbi:MAG: capsule assembly Wzi family protein, partial [bacterium]